MKAILDIKEIEGLTIKSAKIIDDEMCLVFDDGYFFVKAFTGCYGADVEIEAVEIVGHYNAYRFGVISKEEMGAIDSGIFQEVVNKAVEAIKMKKEKEHKLYEQLKLKYEGK